MAAAAMAVGCRNFRVFFWKLLFLSHLHDLNVSIRSISSFVVFLIKYAQRIRYIVTRDRNTSPWDAAHVRQSSKLSKESLKKIVR
jgi:hypothetical protein